MKTARKWSSGSYDKVAGKSNRLTGPAQVILSLYIVVLVPSTLILATDLASVTGLPWIDALFTATSALTVTGLSVVDTSEHFSVLGQVWLMVLMQLGGLGHMTLGGFVLYMLGKKLSSRGQKLAREELNYDTMRNVIPFIKAIVIFALLAELIGTSIMALVWVPELGWAKGLYCSLFHAISAFNNAGFSLFSDSLIGYDDKAIITLTVAGLFIIGGLGFTVVMDLGRYRVRRRLALHSKIVLVTSSLLLVGGTVLIFLLEYDNVETIGGIDSIGYRWMAAFFQSASARTAGFNSVDINGLHQQTELLMMVLMFIGAGSISTGGGIKVSTFAVAIIATTSFLQGKRRFSVFKRNIAPIVVLKSLAIICVSIMMLLTATFLLMITEGSSFDIVLFETISAFSTVGISAGLTANLTDTGKFIMIVVMIIGRVGPLTLAYIMTAPKPTQVRYADGAVITG